MFLCSNFEEVVSLRGCTTFQRCFSGVCDYDILKSKVVALAMDH